MTHYSVAAALGAIVLIYFFSALSPLPWYHYLPFIGLFAVVFYWGDLRRLLGLGRGNSSRLRLPPHCRRKSAVKSTVSHGKRI